MACATIVACDNKFDDYDPAEKVEGAQAYFSNESATTYTISRVDVAPIAITVMRGETEAALSLPITLTQGEEAAFSAPAKAEFKAGQNKATIEITYDPAKLADGATYKVSLAIGDQSATTPYGNNVMNLTIKVPEPYVLLGTGLFTEDLMTTFYSVDNVTYEVEIYENLNNPGYIFLKNVYTSLYPYNDPGDYVEDDVYLAIKVEDPNEVVIPRQKLGHNWGYGDIEIATATPGTLKDGIITFPVKGLLICMPEYNTSFYYSNPNGKWRVVMPGVELTDYSLNMSFAGMQVGADKSAKPLVDVVFGADVAQIAYTVVPENIQFDSKALAAVVAGIADGSIETTVVDAVDEINDPEKLLQMQLVGAEALEEGVYTMVALPINAAGEIQSVEAAALAFYMNSIADSPEMDFVSYLLPFSALFPEYAAYYPDSSCMAWYAEGSNIKAWKQLMAKYSVFKPYLDKGVTLKQLVLANGEDYEDLGYINNDGYDYNYYEGLAPETDYLMVHYVEDIFGNVKVTANLHTTAAEETEETAKSFRKLNTTNVKFEAAKAMNIWNE